MTTIKIAYTVIALLHSVFMGLYATTIWFQDPSHKWRDIWKKARFTPHAIYQIILNGLGVAVGWLALAFVLFAKIDWHHLNKFQLDWTSGVALLVALLGISGFLPKILAELKIPTRP